MKSSFSPPFKHWLGHSDANPLPFFKTIYQQISESDFIFYRSNNSNLNSVSQIPSTTLLPSSVGYSNWGLVFLSDCFTVALNPGCYTYIAFKEFFNLRILIASNSAFICRYYMIRGTCQYDALARTCRIFFFNLIHICAKNLLKCTVRHFFFLQLNVYSIFVSLLQSPVEIENFWLMDCNGFFFSVSALFKTWNGGKNLKKN